MSIYSIYKITNIITQKSYIGKSHDANARFRTHISEANRKVYDNYFHRSIRKYGSDKFILEIIESNIDDEDIAYEKERLLIKKYNTLLPNGYNSNLGGKGGSFGVKISLKTIMKRNASRKQLGWYVTPLGKYRSAELSPFATNTTCRWCKNADKIISTNSYSKSSYLQTIGSCDEISKKTYREIGFWYELLI